MKIVHTLCTFLCILYECMAQPRRLTFLRYPLSLSLSLSLSCMTQLRCFFKISLGLCSYYSRCQRVPNEIQYLDFHKQEIHNSNFPIIKPSENLFSCSVGIVSQSSIVRKGATNSHRQHFSPNFPGSLYMVPCTSTKYI